VVKEYWRKASLHVVPLLIRMVLFLQTVQLQQRLTMLFNRPDISENVLLPMGISTASNTSFFGSVRVSSPKPHLDRFSCFCRAHEHDQQTDRQTYRRPRAIPSLAIANRLHLTTATMRPNNNNNNKWSGNHALYGRQNLTNPFAAARGDKSALRLFT